MSRGTLRCLLAACGLWLIAIPAFATDTVYYYLTDALHSEVVVTDQSRNIVEQTQYAPYGRVLNRELRDGPGYTGHEEDPATGLVYMQQRYYDPTSGRFLSTDPVQVTASGGNVNRYWYASDNPYRYTDPDGRMIDRGDYEQEHPFECTGGARLACQEALATGKQKQKQKQAPLMARISTMDNDSGIFGVVGKAIATDVAYVQGMVTGNRVLMSEAASGFSRDVGTKRALAAVFALGTMGEEGVDPLPGTRVRPGGVPENWRIRSTDAPGGVKYSDPRNPGNQVRVMQGNSNSPYPNSRGPYVRQLRNGQWIDAQGNPVLRNDPAGHIPLDQYPGYQQ